MPFAFFPVRRENMMAVFRRGPLDGKLKWAVDYMFENNSPKAVLFVLLPTPPGWQELWTFSSADCEPSKRARYNFVEGTSHCIVYDYAP